MIEINEKELEAKLLTKEEFLVDFYSEFCGKCRQVAQWVEKNKEKFNVPIYKMNIDHRQNIQEEYNVKLLPTIVAFKNGEVYKNQESKSTFAFMKEFIEVANLKPRS
jgi:thioredoxin 1